MTFRAVPIASTSSSTASSPPPPTTMTTISTGWKSRGAPAPAPLTSTTLYPMTSSDGPEESPSTSSFYSYSHRSSTEATMRSSSPLSAAAPPPHSSSSTSSSSFSSYSSTSRRRAAAVASSTQPPNTRSYKSTASIRHHPPSSPSSAASSLRLVHANARRLARKSPPNPRDFSLGRPENPFAPGAYALGAMRNGEWEEWTDDEEKEMEMEQRREMWYRRRALEQQAMSELGDVQEEEHEDEHEGNLEQEPPDDVIDLYDGPDLLAASHAIPRLPSLASDPGNSSTYEDDDTEMEDSQASSYSELATVEPSVALMTFSNALLASQCPRCRELATIQGRAQEGARCVHCGWGLPISTLQALANEFARHHHPTDLKHKPIFAWDQYTETLIFCTGCDESFAA